MHFTLTSASWLNLVSVGNRSQAIRRGTFTSAKDLITAMRTFIDGWSERCHPFVWIGAGSAGVSLAGGLLVTETKVTARSPTTLAGSCTRQQLPPRTERWVRARSRPTARISALAVTDWPTSPCCAASRACTGWSTPTRRVSRTVDTLARDADPGDGREGPPDHGADAEHPLIVDVDATLMESPSVKQGAGPTFRRAGWDVDALAMAARTQAQMLILTGHDARRREPKRIRLRLALPARLLKRRAVGGMARARSGS
jgi:hypothetical protein